MPSVVLKVLSWFLECVQTNFVLHVCEWCEILNVCEFLLVIYLFIYCRLFVCNNRFTVVCLCVINSDNVCDDEDRWSSCPTGLRF